MADHVKHFLRCGSPKCAGRSDGPTILTHLRDDGVPYSDERDSPNTYVSGDTVRWFRGETIFESNPDRADMRITCGVCDRVWLVQHSEFRGGVDILLGVDAGKPIGT